MTTSILNFCAQTDVNPTSLWTRRINGVRTSHFVRGFRAAVAACAEPGSDSGSRPPVAAVVASAFPGVPATTGQAFLAAAVPAGLVPAVGAAAAVPEYPEDHLRLPSRPVYLPHRLPGPVFVEEAVAPQPWFRVLSWG